MILEATDELTVEISPCAPNEFSEGGVYFVVTAFANGERLVDWLDVDEFFKSLNPKSGDGRRNTPRRGAIGGVTRWLPIFNCDCGVFGCGGYYVDVTLTREALVWEGAWARADARKGDGAVRTYAFPWENLRNVASELLAAINASRAHSPNGSVRSGSTGVDLIERLPYYRAVYEALPNDIGGNDGEAWQI